MAEEITLYKHNIPVFERFRQTVIDHRICMLDSCPGSGKSYILLKFLEEFGGRTLIICPKKAISDEWRNLADRYGVCLDAITYQGLCKLSAGQIEGFAEKYGCFVFDECHHIGAPTWQENIKYLMEGHPEKVFIGLTATPVRYHDRRRDVGKEFFGGHVVKGVSQIDAVEQGILPGYQYIAALFQYSERIAELKKVADKARYNRDIIYEMIRRLEQCPENTLGIYEAFDRYLPDKDRKGIVFVHGIADIKNAVETIKGYFGDDDSYLVMHSELDQKDNKRTLEEFKNTEHGWLFVVDMLNEGLHIPQVDTVIMLRNTVSPNIYIQQLGRSQAVGGKGAVIFDFVGNRKNLRIASFETFNKNGKTYAEYKADPRIIVNYIETDAYHLLKEIESNLIQQHRPWTKEEDDFLRREYPSSGCRACADALNRSWEACNRRASDLHLKRMPSWPEKDVDFLISHYKNEGGRFCADVLGKTVAECNRKAIAIGLSEPAPKKWSDHDIIFLKENYPVYGSKYCAEKLGRSVSSCEHKASKLNIRQRSLWTDEEKDWLKKHFASLGALECAEHLNKTIDSCRHQASLLGIRQTCATWTEEEEEFIKENYISHGGQYCAELLGKTKSACARKAKDLGVSRRHTVKKWTKEEDEFLRTNYLTYGSQYCSKHLDRTEDACRARAKSLKVNKETASRRWTADEDEFLEVNYSSKGAQYCSDHLYRTECACKARARAIGANKKDAIERWTAQEDGFLEENYPIYGAKYCAEHLTERPGVPRPNAASCQRRANVLGLKFHNMRWTDNDLAFIKENYELLGARGCSKKISHSESACAAQAKKLGLKHSRTSPWADEEEEFLKENYLRHGARYCSEHLSDRTVTACRHRAHELGIYDDRKKWSEEEDAVLRENYASLGPSGCTNLLKDKDKVSCQNRAQKLGLRCSRNLWTEEEEKFLRENYPSHGARYCSDYLNGRTLMACKSHAQSMGLKAPRAWTKEEDAFLKENYPDQGAGYCSEHLQCRTASACKARANFLGLKRSRNWTEEEDEYLKENYPKYGPQYCSEQLHNKTRTACISRAAVLNIGYNSLYWTEEEDSFLRENYHKYGAEYCSAHLKNRTVSACQNRAQTLQISNKKGEWTKEEDMFLKENYTSLGAKECSKLLSSHSPDSCAQRASRLNISVDNLWTENEDSFLKDNYITKGHRYCAEHFPTDRTYNAIGVRARALGLTGKDVFEVPEEIDGNVYEAIVQQYLVEHGYRHVMLTARSHDFGVDTIVEKDGVRYGVQCKHWSEPVGISAVQQIVAGLPVYGCDRGIVVTSNVFTKSAQDLASLHNVILMEGISEADLETQYQEKQKIE